MDAVRTGAILIHRSDNVAVALKDIAEGSCLQVGGLRVVLRDHVPRGHKFAVSPIPAGSPVFKYGHYIGTATKDILPGEHVHDHNMVAGEVPGDRKVAAGRSFFPDTSEPDEPPVFKGFLRPDGSVGIRNYVAIMTTVSCANPVASRIADIFRPRLEKDFPGVDGVVAFGHTLGCGMAARSPGLANLRRSIAGYCNHPSFFAVVLLGLGCETNQLKALLDEYYLKDRSRLLTVNIQDVGGTERAVEIVRDWLERELKEASAVKRVDVPVSRLVVGLECGGSDAFSGITANPSLGVAVDMLVGYGGTAVLSETPEIYGAEHILMTRAVNDRVSLKLAEKIEWWKNYTGLHGCVLDNNPQPGNKAGGITTIYEKSLGAVSKGGTTSLRAVYDYAERITETGLVFMDTPGYDVTSITGMVAGGAHLICFTTGRGSVLGCKPAPVIKIASNSDTFLRMQKDMDLNAGAIIDEGLTLREMGECIFREILEVASGKKTKSESFGFGDDSFVPWHIGAVI
ncbi:UxaA family hydrolase [Thermodesulforhabdus norvegica]|uniref:Altronate hydrolase n=1 Tax=Thermodesulforhabdus norvegica TaxID=39841 RepID=A0A1I4R2K5_9BACT|nr:altronate dehydratase family protein [Thermodesulforhabdus norvegica]SFM46538.1 altronate hydrolase [Thermodesulforhabdus norvegica]